MTGSRIVLEVPDLGDDRVRLRPWHPDDAPALVEAWNDPVVIAGTRPPDDRSERAARRWIEGWEIRRRAGVALDLVVTGPDDDRVRGEVGLSGFDVSRKAAMVGWWLGPDSRGRGYASAAVDLVADWVVGGGHLTALLARIDPANPASARVADRAGFVVLQAGRDGADDVWVRR